MKLFLIRHAETVHNVAQAWAGTTDSALTNHGTLQIESLAKHFASNAIHFGQVFASDLSRAHLTAAGICLRQPQDHDRPLAAILTSDLRERDFGSLEGIRIQSTSTRPERGNAPPSQNPQPDNRLNPTYKERETVISMRQRATSFLNEHLLPLLFDYSETGANVAIVSHGVFLRVLWNRLVELFDPMDISLATGDPSRDNGPAALFSPSWSNTGFMTLSIQPIPAPKEQSNSDRGTDTLLNGWAMKIMAVDSKEHLAGLHRTRGGIGSAVHDSRQKRIDQFFKR
ncbi:hypothetical protein N7466_011257 [Penicillium verhagenii]|uniref:uncharacterized protein n=1 Tax=Penicillium verhagenii TaxID=1562060 RepID=UPI0025457E7F|nr:uncharacterized protein N7466_011676 [Penicillium verhagenii]XP_057016378.1 uncharacterized protein N7466_011257 [Penicillium verhagenii]KAJ5915743.1 hypothetical protein N7466_011676 [Penicillium verhagenii]KAJ5917703.1 hypothetical protein N7466_011257 [Penicillium verhagenii]